MKILLVILLLSSGAVFGQTFKNDSKHELKQTIESQLKIIDSMSVMLEEAKSQGAESVELILKLQRENEALKTIMRDYIKQIDDLNYEVMRMNTELTKCKD